MKKIFSLMVAIIVVALLVAGNADAAATKARNASFDKGILSVNGIGDLSTGNTVEIDENGNMAVELFGGANQMEIDANGSVQVKNFTKSVVTETGDGTDLCDGAAIVYSITIYGDPNSSAGDAIMVSDGENFVFDISIGTAKDTNQILFPGGIAFVYDVVIDAIDDNVYTTIVYSDY